MADSLQTELNTLCSKSTGTGVNIAKIHGGEKHNIVPDYAEMEFEVRYDSTDEYHRMLNLIEELKIHAAETKVRIEIRDTSEVPPLVPGEKTLEYEKHIRKLSEDNGIPYKIKSRGGFSDANHISDCGVICVDGLGATGDFDHSEYEYL